MARAEPAQEQANEPLPQFMSPAHDATKKPKKGGLFSGLAGRLGRSGKSEDDARDAVKSSNPTVGMSQPGPGRQRIVNGWQGGGAPLQWTG